MVEFKDIERRFKSVSIEDRAAGQPSYNAVDKLKDKLWKNYTIELCNRDLALHKMRQSSSEIGNRYHKQNAYFGSTVNRLMFRRLLVRAGLTGKAVTLVTVAETLNISSKAAMTMVTECIDMGLVERVEGFVSGETRNKYTGTDELCNCFLQTAAVNNYRNGEPVVRAYDLYTEMTNLIDRSDGDWEEG